MPVPRLLDTSGAIGMSPFVERQKVNDGLGKLIGAHPTR